ncbi:hypothetical protein AAXB25_22730 [Paenibacillus lautus]|uniref:hypothetical protein n=1 Tax=Paenibacillus lautus TaxID=1401 RepID=UPI003D2AD016
MPKKKKILFLLIIGVMIIASFVIMDINKPDKMVISYIKVIEKNNEDNKDYIVGINPHDPEAKPVKIYIKEKNVWNIVMVDQTYLATYDFISSNSYNLDEIKLPD